jgi:hypothetical protein
MLHSSRCHCIAAWDSIARWLDYYDKHHYSINKGELFFHLQIISPETLLAVRRRGGGAEAKA